MKTWLLIVLLLAASLPAPALTRDSVYVVTSGDTVRVWDIGALLNCASLWIMETRLSHDTLYVEQTDTVRNKARCICLFDFCAKVTGLARGSYHAVVLRVLSKAYGYPLDTVETVGSTPFVVSGGTAGHPALVPYQSVCYTEGEFVSIEPPYPYPSSFALEQNFPNPFNPGTRIRFGVTSPAHIRLAVYDLLGQEVEVLVDEQRAPGGFEASFSPRSLAAGVYIYRMTAGGQSATRMMQLIR
jgi:hypothetical protein